MAQLTTQIITRSAPLTPALVAATVGGDTFTPGDNVFFHVKNGAGSSITVTFATPGNVDGIALAGYQITVPATTGDIEVGPFPANLFANNAGVVAVTYSAVTTVTVGVKELAAI